MPNWCDYSLNIKGDRDTIKKLHEKFCVPVDEQEESWDSMKEYDLTRILPVPEELQIMSGFMNEDSPEYAGWKAKQEANKEKYGYADWYWWCVNNWGTKWPPAVSYYDVEFDDDTGWINVSGQSAWSGPDGLVRNMTEMFPVKAVLSYEEGGMCFAGAEGWVNGECVHNGYFEYDNVPSISEASENEPDSNSDEWHEWWENLCDAVLCERDRQEQLACHALGWTTEVPS